MGVDLLLCSILLCDVHPTSKQGRKGERRKIETNGEEIVNLFRRMFHHFSRLAESWIFYLG